MKNIPNQKNAIIIYERKDGAHFDVTFEDETVWLTQNQIANLFVVKKAAVSKHIKHIYDEGELARKATVSKKETAQREGGRMVTRMVEYYNLDMIISVGYRVSSRRATAFRIWATKILKDTLMKGISINERRLKELQRTKINELEQTVQKLERIIEAQKHE